MNKLLLAELRKLERGFESMLNHIKSEMDNDPKSNILQIELEFQAFLIETQGITGARTSSQGIAKVNDLYQRKQREEERAKLWNHLDLSNDWILWSGALGDLKGLLWNAAADS